MLIQNEGKLTRTINITQQPSEPFSNLQVLSETTNIYQQLPGTISPLHHPSMTFSNLQGSFIHYQGLSATSWDYQQQSTTFRTIQQPPGPFGDCQHLTERVSEQRLEWTKVRTGENTHGAIEFNKINN